MMNLHSRIPIAIRAAQGVRFVIVVNIHGG